MTSNFAFDSKNQEDRKNIKNIYVHKINSLMKLSKDTLLKEDFENSSFAQKKKIKKTTSFVDKHCIKLQKNRQSAKKARMRKKMYIKMLEHQIQSFKRIQNEGQRLNNESQAFLMKHQNLNSKKQISETLEQDVNVDKFLSGDDLGQLIKNQNQQYEEKLHQRDKVIEQLYQISTSSLFKRLKNTKSVQCFIPILKRQAKGNIKHFEILVKKISQQYDKVKEIFVKLGKLTEEAKSLRKKSIQQQVQAFEFQIKKSDICKVKQFMQKLNLARQTQYDQNIGNIYSEFSQQRQQIKEVNQQLNLHSAEKLLIRSQLFFENTLFDQDQKMEQYHQNA